MNVVSQSETKLTLSTDPLEIAYVAVGLALSIIITALIVRAIGEMARGIVSLGIYTVSAVASAMLVGLLARKVRSGTTYTFCRESGHLTIRTEILWWSRTRRDLLQDIAAVVLGKQDARHYWVELRLRSGEEILLRADDRERVADVAERVSTFLNKPLFYVIMEKGVPRQTPAAAIRTRANCVSCGAPVRFIETGASHVTCEYCAAILPVEWVQGESYRQATSGEGIAESMEEQHP
jgi:hypothetical protein